MVQVGLGVSNCEIGYLVFVWRIQLFMLSFNKNLNAFLVNNVIIARGQICDLTFGKGGIRRFQMRGGDT